MLRFSEILNDKTPVSADDYFLQTPQFLTSTWNGSLNEWTRRVFFQTYAEFNEYYGDEPRDESEFYQLNLDDSCASWVDQRPLKI